IIEQVQEQFLTQHSILTLGTAIVRHRPIGTMDTKERRNTSDAYRHIVAPGHLIELVPQSRATVVEAFVDLWRKLVHGRQASLHGHGIGIERPTMGNTWGLSGGIKRLHDISPATKGAYR